MPHPGGGGAPNTSAASGNAYNLPYPTSGGSFPPYPPGPSNNFGGYPPYPASGNSVPAATSGPRGGYPPYMNFPPAPGYNSGYVSYKCLVLLFNFWNNLFNFFNLRLLQIPVQQVRLPRNILKLHSSVQ